MHFVKIEKPIPGAPIKAGDMAKATEACEWTSRIRANPPLAIESTAGGPLLRWAGQVLSIWLIKTTSAITARDGTTPGSGTAKLHLFDGTDLIDLDDERTVYNFAGGTEILTDKYGIAMQIGGSLFILAIEC
jgi:hypothetical protein